MSDSTTTTKKERGPSRFTVALTLEATQEVRKLLDGAEITQENFRANVQAKVSALVLVEAKAAARDALTKRLEQLGLGLASAKVAEKAEG